MQQDSRDYESGSSMGIQDPSLLRVVLKRPIILDSGVGNLLRLANADGGKITIGMEARITSEQWNEQMNSNKQDRRTLSSIADVVALLSWKHRDTVSLHIFIISTRIRGRSMSSRSSPSTSQLCC